MNITHLNYKNQVIQALLINLILYLHPIKEEKNKPVLITNVRVQKFP
jgi:hypothetical protein